MGGIVNTVGQMVGMGGGSGGTGFSPSNGTSQGQLQTAWQGSQDAMQGQQALLTALQGQNGIQNQSNVYNQLQNVASGNGPNPAQAMLNQATGQNVANQAALMAGQRGASANPGLMARQAAMQGANIQQQAAGQGATMQAQQALNALSAAGTQANTMAGQQIAQANQNAVSQQNEQGILQGANSNYSNNQTTLGNTRMGQQGQAIGGLLSGAGAGGQMLSGGSGLQAVSGMAEGGQVPSTMGPQSSIGQYLMSQAQQQSADQVIHSQPQPAQKSSGGGGAQLAQLAMMFASQGGNVGSKLKAGGHVPGQAKMSGDNLKNDTVHAMLSPGEIVIPRSVLQGKDPARGAAEFVAQVMAKKKVKK